MAQLLVNAEIVLVSLCKSRYNRVAGGSAFLGYERSPAGDLAMAGAVQAMLREVMDIRQAADYLGISGDTLYRYASEGFVPAFKLGNRWRFKKSLLDAWMDEKSGVRAAPVGIAVVAPEKKKPAGRARLG